MKTISFSQGSPEWHAHRANHFNASDAPAMLGCSPYTGRQELLRRVALGAEKEIDAATQRIFDNGHKYEALARPIAEQIIGEDLFPVTGTEGKLSASFDGLTMMHDTAFEHKSLNIELRQVMAEGCQGSDLPKHYRVQMEQQCMVSGAERVLFMASKWEGESLVEEYHCWYYPNADLRDEILQGWTQFAIDLQEYQHAEVKELPVAKGTEDLPVLFVHAKGEITANNMDEFGKALTATLAETRSIVLITDQDFSNAKAAAKKFRETAKAIAQSKEQMLAQTETIGEAARKMDAWAKDLNATALQLEKDVEREDRNKKEAIIRSGKEEYSAHVAELEVRVSPARLNLPAPNFAEAIKGKRNYSSMQDAVADALAAGKIAANAQADLIEKNQKHFHVSALDSKTLFPDLNTLVYKQHEDFAAVVKMRIQEHAAAEQAKALAESTAKEAAAIPATTQHNPDAPGVITAAPAPAAPVTTKRRPTDKEIVHQLSIWYGVSESVAIRWIKEMDFSEMKGAA